MKKLSLDEDEHKKKHFLDKNGLVLTQSLYLTFSLPAARQKKLGKKFRKEVPLTALK